MRLVDSSGSTAGKMPSEEIARERTVVASRCANVVAGARLMRETERRADNARVLARAAAAPSRAAQSQFEDLAGEGPVELGDL